MTQRDRDPTEDLISVNWDTPEMRALLERTRSLHLDKRGGFDPRPVLLRRGWHDGAPTLDAIVVAQAADGGATVLTTYALDAGEPVMVDFEPKLRAGIGRDLFEVVSCHHGARAEERDLAVFVSSLRPASAHLPGR